MEWMGKIPVGVWYGVLGLAGLSILIVGSGYLITIIKGGKASIGKEGIVCDTEEDEKDAPQN